MHRFGKEAWLAGSIQKDELLILWDAGADVVCFRGAACRPGKESGRLGQVDSRIVADLAATTPGKRRRG